MKIPVRRAVCGASALLVLLVLAGAKSTPPAPAAKAPQASRALAARIQGGQGAESLFRERIDDPLGGEHERTGRLRIEAPAFVRLEYGDSGEVITLRPDGGEWLQPGLGQMLRFGASGQEVARVWRLLLGVAGDGVTERRRSSRGWTLVPSGSDLADSAWVDLDPAGLPARLTVFAGDATTNIEYRFAGWKFGAPLGKSAFTIKAPKGIHVIDADRQ
jgi:hypothetical protein